MCPARNATWATCAYTVRKYCATPNSPSCGPYASKLTLCLFQGHRERGERGRGARAHMGIRSASIVLLFGLLSLLAVSLTYKRTAGGEDVGRFAGAAAIDAEAPEISTPQAPSLSSTLTPPLNDRPAAVDSSRSIKDNAAAEARGAIDYGDEETPWVARVLQSPPPTLVPDAHPAKCWIFNHMNKSGGTTVKFLLDPYLARNDMKVALYDSGQWRGGGESVFQ